MSDVNQPTAQVSNQVAPPPPGAPVPPPPRVYGTLDAKNETFVVTNGSNDPNPRKTLYLTGYLVSSWAVWDLGHWGDGPKSKNHVPARWTVYIELDSPEFGLVKAEFGATAGCTSVAWQLSKVNRGDFIGISVKKYGDAALTETQIWDGERWGQYLLAPKKEGDDSDEAKALRLAMAVEAMSQSSAYTSFVSDHKGRYIYPKGGNGQPMPKGPTSQQQAQTSGTAGKPTPPAQQFSGSAEGGANPASQAPGVTTQTNPAPTTPALVALGFTAPRVPEDAHWTTDATPKQKATNAERLAARGFTPNQASNVRYTLLLEYGYGDADPFEDPKFADMVLVNDFLGGATEEQVAQLRAKVAPEGTATSSNAADKFADE